MEDVRGRNTQEEEEDEEEEEEGKRGGRGTREGGRGRWSEESEVANRAFRLAVSKRKRDKNVFKEKQGEIGEKAGGKKPSRMRVQIVFPKKKFIQDKIIGQIGYSSMVHVCILIRN